MQNWYYFSASGNYSETHNWNAGYTSWHVEQEPDIPEENTEYNRLGLIGNVLCSDCSYGGSHSAWGYVKAKNPETAEKILVKFLNKLNPPKF